jgi:hypothetical protein
MASGLLFRTTRIQYHSRRVRVANFRDFRFARYATKDAELLIL